MKKKVVIINGSARSDGNTTRIVETLIQDESDWQHVFLNNFQIGHYDYNHENAGDDFMNIIDHAILPADIIVFASPVYWYSMSGHLKVFFDRLSDLLQTEKDKGRRLRTKSMAVVSCGSEEDHDPSFFNAFERSADYLGMHYLGHCHTWISGENIPLVSIDRLDQLRSSIKQHQTS